MSQKSIEDLLNLLSMGGELNEAQKKTMNDYKFWKTQPVPAIDETIEQEGPIHGQKTPDDIPDEPYQLIPEFEWCTMDLDVTTQLDEVYQLLYENYVEDQDETFRFKYSHEFFRWALQPPGWRKEWHIGVRVKTTGKLVAFISGIASNLKLIKSQTDLKSVDINFLCVHKKLRKKRLTPVLVKEVTRRVNKADIWHALYTGGAILPKPVSTCRYAHRPINWDKLYEVGFSHLPANQTKAKMIAHYALPPTITTKGFRPMEKKDIDQVYELFVSFHNRFELVQTYDKEELNHWLLANNDNGEESNVVKSYVVEDEKGHVTDFMSYFLLPFTVLNNKDHDELGIAYLFYYGSESGLGDDEEGYKKRLKGLMQDLLVTAKKYNVDVFNCLTTQDNPYFIKDCKFGLGDGLLNYYLFNYRTFPIHGGIDENNEVTEDKRSGIGTVLL